MRMHMHAKSRKKNMTRLIDFNFYLRADWDLLLNLWLTSFPRPRLKRNIFNISVFAMKGMLGLTRGDANDASSASKRSTRRYSYYRSSWLSLDQLDFSRIDRVWRRLIWISSELALPLIARHRPRSRLRCDDGRLNYAVAHLNHTVFHFKAFDRFVAGRSLSLCTRMRWMQSIVVLIERFARGASIGHLLAYERRLSSDSRRIFF